MLELPKYSLGIGDRFGKQGVAQLEAIIKAKEAGTIIAPVWNKSHREHELIGTNPIDVRKEADNAVTQLGWDGPYFVDADHVDLTNIDGYRGVDSFIDASDFFTIDVADKIGKPSNENLDDFVKRYKSWTKTPIRVNGLGKPLKFSEETLRNIGTKYLSAIEQAKETYQFIKKRKGEGNFITEVSMDETKEPQSPLEMLVILQELSKKGVPVQTIAPKFSAKFLKGIDCASPEVAQFESEFRQYVAVAEYARKNFKGMSNLKLSIHSGSDKFSLYPIMNKVLKEFDAGIHLKTAGTTWLEELIGLAKSGEEGLQLLKDIYRKAYDPKKRKELIERYDEVTDINQRILFSPDIIDKWDGEHIVSVLTHDQSNPKYNKNFRQFMHVAYPIIAEPEMKERYFAALEKHKDAIHKNVTTNLYERHIRPLFLERVA